MSNLGDGLRLVALPLLVATLTRDPIPVSALTAIGFLPWLTVGPFSGAIVDRVRRQRLIVGVQLIRGTALLVFSSMVALDAATLWAIYTVAAVVGVGETFADTAAQAVVPRLASSGQLEQANSRLIAAEVATNEVAGGPLGGVLFALSRPVPFVADALTYLAGAVLVARIRTPLDAPALNQVAPRTTVRADVLEGLGYLRRDRLQLPIAAAIGITNLGLGATSAILVLFALEQLGLDSVGFGLLMGAGALGGLAGASIASRLSRRWGRRATMITATVVAAVAMAAAGYAPNAVLAGAALASAFGAIAVFNVVGRALRQAVTPDRLLGRLVAATRLVAAGTTPFGALLGGLVAETHGLRAPFLLAGVALLVSATIEARALDDDVIAARTAARDGR